MARYGMDYGASGRGRGGMDRGYDEGFSRGNSDDRPGVGWVGGMRNPMGGYGSNPRGGLGRGMGQRTGYGADFGGFEGGDDYGMEGGGSGFGAVGDYTDYGRGGHPGGMYGYRGPNIGQRGGMGHGYTGRDGYGGSGNRGHYDQNFRAGGQGGQDFGDRMRDGWDDLQRGARRVFDRFGRGR